ncbi:ER membrane protein SH3-domain-containing protein [Kalaharituber pfeilii]|nr:ER membrane protein SH3-domain-containing protein [Kalaharituber pfeilii]
MSKRKQRAPSKVRKEEEKLRKLAAMEQESKVKEERKQREMAAAEQEEGSNSRFEPQVSSVIPGTSEGITVTTPSASTTTTSSPGIPESLKESRNTEGQIKTESSARSSLAATSAPTFSRRAVRTVATLPPPLFDTPNRRQILLRGLLLPRYPLHQPPLRLPTLWTTVPAPEPVLLAIESHYRHLSLSPLVPRLLNFFIILGLSGFLSKLIFFSPRESNYLFDGASLILYLIALIMYGTNVIQGIKIIETGNYGTEVPREETLRVLGATQTMMALVLLGVLVLQAGQWYAESKEVEEEGRIRKEEEKGREVAREGGKKKV